MLTVFQIWVDLEHSQALDTATGLDPRLFETPRNGESIKDRNWPDQLEVFDPESPRANFFSLHESFLLMDEAARRCLAPVLEPSGEFIQFQVSAVERAFLFNPLTRLDEVAVDWTITKGKGGIYHNLTLKRDWVPQNSIFRIAKMGSLFCSSELGDEADDLFTAFNRYRLSGLRFKRMWDEHAGAVPGRSTALEP